MAEVAIIGGGSFGTGLAVHASQNRDIIIYSIEPDVVAEINERHTTRYLPGIRLESRIRATGELREVALAKVWVVTVPSSVVQLVARELEPHYDGQLIISASKGLSPDGRLMSEVIEQAIGCPSQRVVALSGPNIAAELAGKKPSVVVAAGTAAAVAVAKEVLATERLIVESSHDKRGIQLLGFYKNIIALLLGICEGLELGSNFKAAMITKAYNEFYHLNYGKHIEQHSFLGYAGLGDLYVTSTSTNSRNRRFGAMLAEGKDPELIKKEIGQVVEGYGNLLLMAGLKDKHYLDENLLRLLLRLTSSKNSPDEMRELLIDYLKSKEIKAIVLDWGNVLTEGFFIDRVAEKLAGKYNLDKGRLAGLFRESEGELLCGRQGWKEYHELISGSYPMIPFKEFVAAYKESIVHNKEMLDYCRELKKRFRLYLFSNNYEGVSGILKKSELAGIFEGMLFSNEIGEAKPHRKAFERLIEEFSLSPLHTLFVDDSPENVQEAERLGIIGHRFAGIGGLKRRMSELAPEF